MIRSSNEISAMVAKAARGAGLPLGVAEDLAAAVPAFCGELGINQTLDDLMGQMAEPDNILSLVSALDLVEASGTTVSLAFAPDPALIALIRQRGCISFASGLNELTLSHTGGSAPRRAPAPEPIDAGIWARLNGFAAQTYVPATEASRIAGAGAGLTDND